MAAEKKKWDQLNIPADRFYHPEHAWAVEEAGQITVGISDYAQDQLGELIFVELPSVGDEFQQGDVFGQAESAKTVSSLYMPVSGRVTEVNTTVEDEPERVNQEPYAGGWLLKISASQDGELEQLLSQEGYLAALKEKFE